MITKTNKRIKGEHREQALFSIFFVVLTLGMIGLLFFSNYKISQRRTELSHQIESLKKEIKSLEEKNAQLKEGIQDTQKDTYWEEKVREQGYKKPGEEQVVVLPLSEKKEEAPQEKKSFWQKFLDPVRNFFKF